MSNDAEPAADTEAGHTSNGLGASEAAPAEMVASDNGTAEALKVQTPVPAPLAQPSPSAEKIKAIEELKAAIKAAAAKPKAKKPETEELVGLCQCVKSLAGSSEVFAKVKDVLPKIGENHLVPLMGIKRAPPRPQRPVVEAKPVPSSSQRVMGRVKSYNTRKGFGFIMVPEFPRDVFVYNSHLIGRIGLLAGEAVVFDLVVEGGRPQARNVKVTGDAPSEQENSAENLATIQKVIADQMPHLQPPPGGSGQSMREYTLAMAAAAAEVPTTLPGAARAMKSPEDLLQEQIRKAQTEASTRQTRKPEMGDMAMSEPWEGNIPRGSTVRVVEFPAPDINGCTGTVRGYDSISGRYQVEVESADGEIVPMSLREEYMQVLERGEVVQAPAPTVPIQPPPPLPGGTNSQSLQKSAADALRRFGLGGGYGQQAGGNWMGGQQMQAPGPNLQETARAQLQALQQQQRQMAQNQGMPGMGKGMGMMRPDASGMPGMMGAGQFGQQAAGMAGTGAGPNPQQVAQARRPPMDMMRGPNKLGPDMGGNQPGQMQMQPPPMPQSQPGQMQAQRPMQGAMQQPDDVQQQMMAEQMRQRELMMQQRRPPGPPAPPGPPGPPGPPAPPMPNMPKQTQVPPPPKTSTRKQTELSPGSTAPEGRPGQIWVVMKSQHFSHVIVRATQEVTSRELRRILPGEAVTQRDMTETLPNGLVRMPVEPDGWVTVHARHINGPTFLTEAQPDVPQQRPNRGREGMIQPPPPPSEKKVPDYVHHAYPRETFLLVRDHLRQQGLQAHEKMRGLRSLIVPNLGDRKGREHRRKDRERDRAPQAQDMEEEDEPRYEPEPPVPQGRDVTREVERPKPATVPKDEEQPTGEEKKANCPTQ